MTQFLRGGLAAAAAVAAVLLLAPTGAAADSVRIGLSSGGSHHNHGHADRYRGHRGYSRYTRYRRGHHSSFGFVYINPYPVYTYSPPPPVVYAPAPAQAAAAPQTADRYCREYQKTVTIGGADQEVYGTACMQPDGSWEIMDQHEVPAYYP